MNVVFLSPNFPLHFYNFCDRLKRLGCNVLGIGDCPYEALDESVVDSLTEYYYVTSLEDYDLVMRAVAFFTFKYGHIDFIESQNEYWLTTEARLREDFNVHNGKRPNELRANQLKSKMKRLYEKAGVKTANWILLESKLQVRQFAKNVGYPLIIKPDRGVGASDTYKIANAEQLDAILNTIDFKHRSYIVEEFVPGHIETFDGITSKDGKIVFCAGQVMKYTPLAMLDGNGENISYTCNIQKSDLMPIGVKTVNAWDLKQSFFHCEFFRLDEDKQGLGNRGDILGLEVNLRAPGGYIPDKMDYAYDVDIYQIWAETIMFGKNSSFADYKFKHYITHYGRGENLPYQHNEDEIHQKFGDRVLLEKIPPHSISGGTGAQVFILKSESVKQLTEDGEYILAKL